LQAGSFQLMKKMNQQIILKLIDDREAISRAEIAEISGLSPATVTNITRALLQMGLIRESREGESRGGRKPVLLELNPAGAYFIGLEWGIAELRGVLINLNREVIAYKAVAVESYDFASFLQLSTEIVYNLLKDSIDRSRIYGLGVGVHGLVDPERGYSLYAPHFKWRDIPVRRELEERLKLPVLIDNDVRVMALAEKWNGRKDFVLINTGPGIGAAIVLDGDLHYGRNYSAGEFGHMTVIKGGPLCSCGNTGCLEALVSTDNLVYRYKPEMKKEKSRQELDKEWLKLLDEARKGVGGACQVIGEIGEYLGMGISNLVNLLNPDEIILAGYFTAGVDLLLPLLRKEVEGRVLKIPGRELAIKVTEFGNQVGAIGAATMVLQDLFNFQEGE
jgi:predicted NBD/HSP70 family sugar kinase